MKLLVFLAIKRGIVIGFWVCRCRVCLVKIRAPKTPLGEISLFALREEDMQVIAVVNEAWRKECWELLVVILSIDVDVGWGLGRVLTRVREQLSQP